MNISFVLSGTKSSSWGFSCTIVQDLRLRSSHIISNIYLQGTTGAPKGATLSHSNIVNNGYFVGKRVGYDWRVSPSWAAPCSFTDWFLQSSLQLSFLPSFCSLTLASACLCPCTTASAPWAEASAWPCTASPWSSPRLATTARPTSQLWRVKGNARRQMERKKKFELLQRTECAEN